MHLPVLLNEVIESLNIKPNGKYIDGTFGRGGHSQAILSHLQDGQLMVIDKDIEAIHHAQTLFGKDPRVVICHGSFANIKTFVTEQDWVGKVAGVLLDLGVSSPQLDTAERGFSFTKEGELDMRMNTTSGMKASEWIAHVGEAQLADVLFQYGEERYSRRIAKSIVEERTKAPITTTKQLAEIVAKAHPNWGKHKHPATKSFQAIRIYINSELQDLELGLEQALQVLESEGRMAVISFHSLEDRLVKQFFRRHHKGEELPRGMPISDKDLNKQRLLSGVKKALHPSAQEISDNPRARSAVLRVAQRK